MQSRQKQILKLFSKISVFFFNKHLFLDFSRKLYVFTEQLLTFKEGIFVHFCCSLPPLFLNTIGEKALTINNCIDWLSNKVTQFINIIFKSVNFSHNNMFSVVWRKIKNKYICYIFSMAKILFNAWQIFPYEIFKLNLKLRRKLPDKTSDCPTWWKGVVLQSGTIAL